MFPSIAFKGEQQKQRDLFQKQKDQIQQDSDRQREDEERQLLALQEQQEKLIQDQLQDQINQQILLNEQFQEQQKQLLQLQQEQQNLIGGANIITTLPIAVQPAPITGTTTSDTDTENNNKPSTTITDDAVIIENTSLTKSTDNTDAEEQPKDTSDDTQIDARSNENTENN